jgi:Fanconi anemia group D2 protein
MLDYLEGLQDTHIRKVFDIFSQLAVHTGEDDGDSFSDELQIMIEKQLASPSDKYKKIGIIGSLTTLRSLSMFCFVFFSFYAGFV